MASSGNLALLASDLQALASETKRRHADIKEASDKALALIKTSPDQILTTLRNTGVPIPGPADDIFRPITMACATKNAKVVVIALGSLQRLIGMDAVPASKIPQIVNLLSTVLPLGVEIQLRILQTLPSLFTRCAQYLHGDLLADALLLCFRLQDSRIGVVSSTAAATLRQLVMVVFEGVAAEDKAVKCSEPDPSRTETDFVVAIPPFESIHLSGETERTEARHVALRPSAKDAYQVFEDLCLLVNGDSPSFLKLQSLPKTFGLELIESVMTGHGNLFQQHPELIFVLRAQLCPLLIRALSEKPTFPLTLRLMRVAFLLLKQFSDDLLVEAEIFLSLIIKTISVDHSEGQTEPVPIWLRVLALEIFRGLCVDFDLLLKIYERYDMRRTDQTSGLFTSLMGTFNRLASEKPALLGINQDIAVGTSSYHISSPAHPGVQGMIDGVVGIATQAAAPLVGTQQGGLSLTTAAMKLQCIDQLDKAEAPVIPETYVYLLALQCICNVAEGFAGFALAQHEEFRYSRSNNPSDDTPPPSLILPIDELKGGPNKERLMITRSMADASWPALLASLNFFVSTNLDEELFNETLSAMQSFTYVCGILDLATPRDAFLLSFCKFAVPPAVVANLIMEASCGTPTKASQSVLSIDTPAHQPTYFSPRSLSFLRTLLSVAQYLSGVLGSSWHTVFETLQNADYVLAAKLKKRTTLPSSQTPNNSNSTSDESVIQASIQKLFDCSRNLNSSAFSSFVTALCRLSSETVGLPTESGGSATTTPKALSFDTRRKASGVPNLRNHRQNERSFAVAKLGSVALLNIRRLVLSDNEVAWTPITSHLLAVQSYPEAPSNIRLQAADVLDHMILSVPKLINNMDETLQSRVQTQIIEVLRRQAAPYHATQTSTDLEVRKLGFETLFKILENNGHSFIAGWKLILDVLRTACKTCANGAHSDDGATPKPYLNYDSATKGKGTSKSGNKPSKLSILVRNSFPSLQLICTDFLTALTLEELRQCISVLAEFARQTDDINIALTSGGLLWQVSDHVQGKNKASKTGEGSYVRLWMFLLSKLLDLGHASRQEVRDGAIQTLFRTIGLYGSSLSSSVWHELLWEVIFPLLDLLSNQIKKAPTQPSGSFDENVPIDVSRQPDGTPISLNAKQLDDSKILALESTGKIVSDHFASHILIIPQFSKTWTALIQHLSESFTTDRPSVSTASMKTLATILNTNISGDQYVGEIAAAWEVVWNAFVKMSEAIVAPPYESQSRNIYFTQAALEAYIQVLHPLQNTSRLRMDHERIKILLQICKAVLTYSKSPDYRPDIDTLPPVHAAVIATFDRIDHHAPDVSSAVISSTAALGTLAFDSPFEVTDTFSTRPSSISVTYIALFKAIQSRLVSLVERFCKKAEVYNSGALTKVLSSFTTPLRLKYGCPAPSKHGNAPALWKTASISFLTIIKSCLPSLTDLGGSVTQEAFESFWKAVVENFKCVLSADCTPELSFDLDQQQAAENFDLAFVASLELDVLPCLGQSRIPDEIICGLGTAVQAASRLYIFDLEIENSHPLAISTPRHPSLRKLWPENCRFIEDFAKQAKGTTCGTTADVSRRPRERFIYWCFDLLFLFCSTAPSKKSLEAEYKRVASLWLPILLTRCIAAMKAHLVDAPIRGTVPFNRLRDEEIKYILRQLLTHPLSNGCSALPLCGDYSSTQPKLDMSWPSERILTTVLAQSPNAHLMCLQPLLIELLACESSNQLGGTPYLYSTPHGDASSLTAYFITYRDLLQISSEDGADVEGCWKDLKLGRIGRSTAMSSDYPDIFSKDLKQLVILCLRKISHQTTPSFDL